MKTAFGYFFLSLAATMTGLLLYVLYFIVTGQGNSLDPLTHNRIHEVELIIYGVFFIIVLVPLIYFGLKWIKREEEHPTTPITDGDVKR